MQNTLNTELLSVMVKNRRSNKGLRTIADEIGDVSAATLSRVEQGKIPDVDTFIKLCKWLEVSTDTFVSSEINIRPLSIRDQVVMQLRSDSALDRKTIDVIINVIDMAYNR